MQYNSHATNQDIVSDIKFWITGSATGTTDFGINDMTRSANEGYNKVASIIMKADGRWEWDDNNFDTLPIATTTMVSGQLDYEIDAISFLNLIRLEMTDPSGNFVQLSPMSYEDKQGVAMTEWAKTPGTPHHYDKVGNSIILYPTPNYSGTLKVYFQRTPSYFVVDDATKEPGFNPLYHRYISLYAAADYCFVNLPDKYPGLVGKMAQIENDIIESYSKRSRDEHLRMSTYKEDYGNEEISSGNENIIG